MNSIRCRQCKHYIEANAGEGKIYGCDCSKCVFEPTTKNNLGVDCISRKAVQTRLKEIINEMETIFADIREREVDDSVCGLCEYDCDHGLDGFANECPGFEKDDCFKLNEKYRAEWLDIKNLPSVTPQLSVPEVSALAEWIGKLTKASEEAYNKGYADGMKDQEPILDKIRAEIETKYGQCDICEYFEDYDYEENDISEYRPIGNIADILQMIDNYRVEQE